MISSKKDRSISVLFIYVVFFEYIDRIKTAIQSGGIHLDSFCESCDATLWNRIGIKLDKNYIDRIFLEKQKRHLKKLHENKREYDTIFVLKGEALSRWYLEELKKLYPKARFVLYLWDDIERVVNFWDVRDLYDDIFTFDKRDARNYNLRFLPLFYCDDFLFREEIDKKEIDVYFSGVDHSDRRKVVEKILSLLTPLGVKCLFFMYTKWFGYYKDLYQRKTFSRRPDYLLFKRISMKKNSGSMRKSKAVIDIQQPSQNGLTMRTIEALAAQVKLITTNPTIADYDFYDERNICIIDRENPIIDPNFIFSDYVKKNDETIKKYSIHAWVKTILFSS